MDSSGEEKESPAIEMSKQALREWALPRNRHKERHRTEDYGGLMFIAYTLGGVSGHSV